MATARRTNSPRQKPKQETEAEETQQETGKSAETETVETTEAGPETVTEEAAPEVEQDSHGETDVQDGEKEAVVTAKAFSYQRDGFNVIAFKGETIIVPPEVYARGKAVGALAD